MYKGTHGTCRSWGDDICKEGFNVSDPGRAGPGCYFWRYVQDSTYANFMAFRWWQSESRKGNYAKAARNADGKKCAIIKSSFQVEDAEVLDISHGELKEHVRGLVKSSLIWISDNGLPEDMTEEDVISSVFQSYVDEIGEEESIAYKLVIADLAVPKGAGGKIGLYFGASVESIVVLDPSCITIDGYEEIESYEYI
ncbi:hypothetical protein PY479_15210 [Shewanella sp. A32]|uniref:hypothetical protein n=1 Tax=Shewanella sp. A32 TaxID=3031327 RepID=UPI0023BA2618|nr:hypothetical protein [Shewanella sp. A32]MDF0535621.1 hypothetical protein [Shewanella sp. A32]